MWNVLVKGHQSFHLEKNRWSCQLFSCRYRWRKRELAVWVLTFEVARWGLRSVGCERRSVSFYLQRGQRTLWELDEAFYWTGSEVVYCKGTKGVHLKESGFMLDYNTYKRLRGGENCSRVLSAAAAIIWAVSTGADLNIKHTREEEGRRSEHQK